MSKAGIRRRLRGAKPGSTSSGRAIGQGEPRGRGGRKSLRIAPGTRFRDLEVQAEIGRGAFSVVYLARDLLVDRTVALKVLRVDSSLADDLDRRFALREARMVGRISSPHIVTIYHVHEMDLDGWVIEMEHVDGPTLDDVLNERGGMTVAVALPILRGVLLALHAAHENGVIHRDIKPGNVLLGKDGAIKLTDFGLSLCMGDQSLSISSVDGFFGTPQYVAPEVISGAPATTASDLWSVGVMAYRMLCGKLPFDGPSLPELFEQIQHEAPHCLNVTVPDDMKKVLGQCFEKDPTLRPKSCARILASLEDVLPAVGELTSPERRPAEADRSGAMAPGEGRDPTERTAPA